MTTPRLIVVGLAGALVLAAGGCSKKSSFSDTSAAPGPLSEFDTLTRDVTGSFTNAEQARQRGADGKPVWMNVELHIVEIHPPQSIQMGGHAPADGSRWFYVEQAEVGALDKPYRQHISEVRQTGDREFSSRVYTFTGDPLRFAGWWKHPESFGYHLTTGDLDERLGCENVVRDDGHGVFTGGTVGTGCQNTSKGASYATSEVTITDHEIRAWDRGFDASGKQVWGSTTGPYILKKK